MTEYLHSECGCREGDWYLDDVYLDLSGENLSVPTAGVIYSQPLHDDVVNLVAFPGSPASPTALWNTRAVDAFVTRCVGWASVTGLIGYRDVLKTVTCGAIPTCGLHDDLARRSLIDLKDKNYVFSGAALIVTRGTGESRGQGPTGGPWSTRGTLPAGRGLLVRRRGWRPVGPQITGRSRGMHAPSPCRRASLTIRRWLRRSLCPRRSVLPAGRK